MTRKMAQTPTQHQLQKQQDSGTMFSESSATARFGLLQRLKCHYEKEKSFPVFPSEFDIVFA